MAVPQIPGAHGKTLDFAKLAWGDQRTNRALRTPSGSSHSSLGPGAWIFFCPFKAPGGDRIRGVVLGATFAGGAAMNPGPDSDLRGAKLTSASPGCIRRGLGVLRLDL